MGIVSAMMQVGAAIKHAAAALFKVTHSLRFDGSGDYLLSAPISASDDTTFTMSAWVKMDDVTGGVNSILSGIYYVAGTANHQIIFSTDGPQVRYFDVSNGTYASDIKTSNSPISAGVWHHVVFQIDTTASLPDDRVKIWVDGTPQTNFATQTTYSQNAQTLMSNGTWPTTSVNQQLTVGGAYSTGNPTLYYEFGGLIAELHFIDGQALTASDFGETRNGQWVPKEVTGVTYGTNGFYLDFSDSSTASALGTDATTNSNDFTVPTNTLTPDDQLIDSPNLRFATWDAGNLATGVTLSEANLKITGTSAATQRGNFLMTSGKWYWEHYVDSGTQYGVGVVENGSIPTSGSISATGSLAVGYWSASGGLFYDGGSATGGATYTSGDVVAIAVDLDAATPNAKFYKVVSGALALQYTHNFGAYVSTTNGLYAAWNTGSTGTKTGTTNFGQDHTFAGSLSPLTTPFTDDDGNGEFYYEPPPGFKALATSY